MLHKLVSRRLLVAVLLGTLTLVSPHSTVRAESPRLYLDFKSADIRDVLRLVAIQSGVAVAAAPEVSGSLTVHLENVTLDEALDIISRSLGYAYEEQGGVYYVFAQPEPPALTIAAQDGRFDIDARAVSLQSLVASLAAHSDDSLVVPPSLDPPVTLFTRSLTLRETLQALAQAHDLYWVHVGDVHFIREREPMLWVQTRNNVVSLIARDATLEDVALLLTMHTGSTVTTSAAVAHTRVSLHVTDLEIDALLSRLMVSANLHLKRDQDTYHFDHGQDNDPDLDSATSTGDDDNIGLAADESIVSLDGRLIALAAERDLQTMFARIKASAGHHLEREQDVVHVEPSSASAEEPHRNPEPAAPLQTGQEDRPDIELPVGVSVLSIIDGVIALEIQSVMISELVPAIATLSGSSFIFQPDVANVPVSGNLKNVPFPDGLMPLLEVHGLGLERVQPQSPPVGSQHSEDTAIYLIRRRIPEAPATVEAGPDGLTLRATGASLDDVVKEIGRWTGTPVIVDPNIVRPLSIEIGPLPAPSLLEALAEVTSTRLTRRGEYYLLHPTDPRLTVEVQDDRLSLSAREADVRDVLGRISELSGSNIAVGPSISGTVTAELTGVTVRHTLELLAELLGWDLTERDGTISVLTPSQPQAPRQTAIRHLSVTEGRLSLSMQDATVRELIEALATHTPENYLADRAILERSVSGQLESVPHVSGLRALLNANGLALQQRDDHYFITAGDSTSALVHYDSETGRVTIEAEGQPLSSLLRALADQADINLVLLQYAPITVNQIRIHDMPFDEALEYLLKGTPLAFRQIDNTYLIGDAMALRPDTADLSDVEMISLRFLSTDQFMAVLPPTLPPANIRVIGSQNSIVASGSPAFLERLKEFVAIVDRPNENVRSVVIEPQHIPSDQLAAALSNLLGGEYFQVLFDENRVIATATESIIQAALDHAALIDRGSEAVIHEIFPLDHLKADFVAELLPPSFDWVTPIVLPARNAVIASGTSLQLTELSAFLSAIDVPTPLIQFDVMVVEITSRDQQQFGLLGTDESGTVSFDLLTPSPLKLTLGTGLSLGADFLVTLNALIQSGSARLLANPTLSTLSGHEASFQVVTKSRFWDPGSQGNQGNPSETRIAGGFHSVETGIKMRLKPWVSASRQITIEIEPEISDAAGTSSGGNAGLPQTNERAVQTTVRVQDGETIVIGGLIQNTSRTTEAKLPILGHLPILGKLFTSTSTVEGETEFIIYITPRVLD